MHYVALFVAACVLVIALAHVVVADAQQLPVTLGSDLGSSSERYQECAGAPCTLVQNALAGATVIAPSNGTITQWSIRNASGTFRLRVLKPVSGGLQILASSAPATLGASNSVSTFPTDLSISAGDYIGLELSALSEVGLIVKSGASMWLFEFAHPEGETLAISGSSNPGVDCCEVLVNATEQPSPPPEPSPPGPTSVEQTTPVTTPVTTSSYTLMATPPAQALLPVFSGATLTVRSLTLSPQGAAKVRVVCPADASERCSGRVTLTTAAAVVANAHSGRKPQVLTLGHAAFSISAGDVGTVSVHLSSNGRALIAARGKLQVRATISSVDASGRSLKSAVLITLHAAHGKLK